MKSISDTQQALIDGFLAGELTDRERAAFDQQLQDPHFREALEWHRQLVQHLEADYRKTALKQELQRTAAAYHGAARPEPEAEAPVVESGARRVRLRPPAAWRAIAAAVSLLVVAAFGWANWNYSPAAIANALEDPLLENTDQSQLDEDLQFQRAKDHFFDGQYAEAARRLRQITPSNSNYPEARVLLAYATYEQEQYAESIRLFTELLDEKFEQLPSRFRQRDKLRWARLLNYVGMGETDAAAFQSELSYFLNSPGDYYREKAETLQRKLESPWRFLSIK